MLATKVVLCITGTSLSFIRIVNSGKSDNTSAISFPLSPQPTYTIISEFECFDNACDITVFPQPNAPGTAQVPPRTDGNNASNTRCPVNNGSVADILSATGLGFLTGHLCDKLYMCFS